MGPIAIFEAVGAHVRLAMTGAVVIGGLLLLLATAPAAQAASDCFAVAPDGAPKATLQAQIDACSARIAAGKSSDVSLAQAYNRRGYAYHQMGDNERALDDFNTSLRISPDCGDVYYNRGLANERLKQTEAALADLTKAIDLHNRCGVFGPLEGWLYLQRGLTRIDAKDYDGAIADVTAAIEIMQGDEIEYTDDNSLQDALNQRAVLYWGTKQWQKALDDLDTLSKEFPRYDAATTRQKLSKTVVRACDDPNLDSKTRLSACNICVGLGDDCAEDIVYYRQATLFDVLGEKDKALAAIEEALRKAPPNDAADFLAERGMLLVDRNQNRAGLADLDRALDGKHGVFILANPTTVYMFRGFAHQSLGEPAKAVDDFTAALGTQDADKLRFELLANRADALIALHRLDAAARDLDAAAKLEPDSPDLQRLVAKLKQQQTAGAATPPVSKPGGGAGGEAGAQVQAALRDCGSGDVTRQITACSRLIALSNLAADKRAVAYYNRGIAYGRSGDSGKAVDDFTHAIGLTPGDAKLFVARGLGLFQLKRDKEAMADFSAAIEIEPKNAGAHYFRGLLYSHLGTGNADDAAIADMSAVIAADPKRAKAYFIRGILHERKHDMDQARADLAKSLDIEPGNAAAQKELKKLQQ